MKDLPAYISVVFGLTTLLTVLLFYRAANKNRATLILVLAWPALQTVISLTGFYIVTNSTPPHFMLLVAPPFLFIILLFCLKKGRQYIDSLNIKILTGLHTVRILVEVVLLWLFLYKAVPRLMTFEGRNFDILAGLSAPFIYYFGFIKNKVNKKLILVWNFICLGLLINIIVLAVLSAPLPFQQFGFEQPNVAVLYFPFVWLPCCVVPLVLFSHLAAIKQLIQKTNTSDQLD